MGALYIAGCGGTSQKLPSQQSATVKVASGIPGPPATGGHSGGSITIGWEQEGNSFDPAIGYDLVSWDSLCNCTTAPLMIFGASGDGPYPNAAAALSATEHNSVYTIHLRPGVRFQNGRRVTAEDYVYSWERLLDPKIASWAASYLYTIDGAEAMFKRKAKTVSGLKVIDPMTLRVQLQAPDLTFPNILAEPYTAPVPREVVEKYGTDFARHVVSTGPFMLTSYSSSAQTCTFTRNPYYFWKGLPYLGSVVYRWGSSAQTELLQLEHGNIDSIGEGIGPSLVPQVYAQPSLKKYVVQVAVPGLRWIGLNLHRPPFTDPRVRQALNYAVNRTEVSHIGYGESVPWGLPFTKSLPQFHRVATEYTYNPEKARALLRAAGAEHASFTLTSTSDDPNPSVAQVLQQQFKAVGVNMSIDTVSDNAYNTATENKNFTAAPIVWYQVQPTALDIVSSNYVSSGSANYWNYSDPKVDALAQRAMRAPDTAQSNVYLAQAERLIAADAPGIFLESLNFIDGRNPKLQNFHYNVFYGTYYDRLWKAA
ncbi:MAG TPA: ABC transporter substrate-binding protein [Solirubrobacteraceae bacterium]|nr:ABC transporter substrate-binding protein [Solirubrobacteraceae bacterium]